MINFFKPQRKFNVGNSNFILVSMYGGDSYYYDCADKLAARCDELNIEHDIVEVKVKASEDWIDICKRKISIYKKLLEKHKKPIFWIDVDTTILEKPSFPENGTDIAIFMRGFNGLNKYDFSKYTRRFEPGYLYLNYTKNTLSFLEHTAKLVKKNSKVKATDDYFLEEGFRSFPGNLRILTLGGNEISRNKNNISDETYLLHGDSGNVSQFKGKAVQHNKFEVSSIVKSTVYLEKAVEFAKKGKRKKAIEFYEYSYSECKSNEIAVEKLTQIYIKDSNFEKLEKIFEDISAKEKSEQINFFKVAIVSLYEAKNFDYAESYIAKAKLLNDKTLNDFISSKMYRYNFDKRALNKNIEESKRTKMFWWEHPHPGNFGDILSPYIVEKLTGIPPKFVGRREGMLAVGSIIKWASDKSSVWGAGTSTENITLPVNANYCAVRGPYTRKEVLKNGGTCPEVYGDPAWILPSLYDKPQSLGNKTGLILHYIHEDTNILIDKKIKHISIRRIGFEQIEEFIDEMRQCERLISTSLHGVILANAYHIPVLWATVTDSSGQIHGDGIKFKDYFSTVGIDENISPIDLSQLNKLTDEELDNYEFMLPKKNIDVEKLIESAPFIETVLEHFKK